MPALDDIDKKIKSQEKSVENSTDYANKFKDALDRGTYSNIIRKLEEYKEFVREGDRYIERYLSGDERYKAKRMQKWINRRISEGAKSASEMYNSLKRWDHVKDEREAIGSPSTKADKEKLQELNYKERNCLMEYSEGKYGAKHAVEDVEKVADDLYNMVESRRPKSEEGSNVGHAVAGTMAAVFGGTVLYALSNIDVSATGAFASGAASPSLLLMILTATVVFFLFFVTHHKV